MPARLRLTLAACLLGPLAARAAEPAPGVPPPPNIILCMADDMGWGDTGYNGNRVLRTPHLDEMARAGVQFNRFYAAAPVCSPTRGSCLTGRHPYRLGITYANDGVLLAREITLPQLLHARGYATGHFGKWHLGTLSRTQLDSNRGGRPQWTQFYAPPWERGFETCFSTESQIPNWDPMKDQAVAPTHYFTGADQIVTDNLEGDDSRVIMDRAIPFIRGSVKASRPFLAVIWFHTPHAPVVAGPAYRQRYEQEDEDHQHYYGAVTALDEQMGRLRAELKALGIEGNTMLWFTSDNGPAATGGGPGPLPGGRQQGVTGDLKGRKGSLHEGGIRVPGILVWPDRYPAHQVIESPAVTSDYLPTVMAALGLKRATIPAELDGIDLLPLLDGRQPRRDAGIGFESVKEFAYIDGDYKLYSADRGQTWQLYNLAADRGENQDLAASEPVRLQDMEQRFTRWRASVTRDKEASLAAFGER